MSDLPQRAQFLCDSARIAAARRRPGSKLHSWASDGALGRTLHTVRHERSRRRRFALLASAAAVVLGLGATTAGLIAVQGDELMNNPAAVSLVAASGSNSQGETSLTARPRLARWAV